MKPKILNFFKPLCCDDKPIVIRTEDKDISIPKVISFELRLMIDMLIFSNIYYGILQLFYPFIYSHTTKPSAWSLINYMILTFWGTVIIGLLVKKWLYDRKLYKLENQ